MTKNSDFSSSMGLWLPIIVNLAVDLELKPPLERRWLLRLMDGTIVQASDETKDGRFPAFVAGEKLLVSPDHIWTTLTLFHCCPNEMSDWRSFKTALEKEAVMQWLIDLSTKLERRCFNSLCLRNWLNAHPDHGYHFEYTSSCANFDKQLREQVRYFLRPITPITERAAKPLPAWIEKLPVVPTPDWIRKELAAV